MFCLFHWIVCNVLRNVVFCTSWPPYSSVSFLERPQKPSAKVIKIWTLTHFWQPTTKIQIFMSEFPVGSAFTFLTFDVASVVHISDWASMKRSQRESPFLFDSTKQQETTKIGLTCCTVDVQLFDQSAADWRTVSWPTTRPRSQNDTRTHESSFLFHTFHSTSLLFFCLSDFLLAVFLFLFFKNTHVSAVLFLSKWFETVSTSLTWCLFDPLLLTWPHFYI